jgi:hypothetical protein
MARYTLEVGIGQGFALQEVEIEGNLVRRQDDCALYRLEGGRHILHVVDGDVHSVMEVEASGRQRISLEEALRSA